MGARYLPERQPEESQEAWEARVQAFLEELMREEAALQRVRERLLREYGQAQP